MKLFAKEKYLFSSVCLANHYKLNQILFRSKLESKLKYLFYDSLSLSAEHVLYTKQMSH